MRTMGHFSGTNAFLGWPAARSHGAAADTKENRTVVPSGSPRALLFTS